MNAGEPTPVDVAIAALTAAARPVDPDTGAVRETDMGQVLCHVITSVAANLGGAEVLLAGRPGSWEADLVWRIVQSTAGEYLDEFRTEPVWLQLDPEQHFYEWGYDHLHDQATGELAARADAVEVDTNGVVTAAGEVELEEITAQEVAVETLRQGDLDVFVASYTTAAQAAAAARGLTVPVQVQRVVVDAGPPPHGELVEALHTAGLDGAVLPSGLRLDQYPAGARPADIDRDAGRTYLTRVARNEDRA